ncbi:hypothetical protein Tco_0643918 [Tanacetum coccineum]
MRGEEGLVADRRGPRADGVSLRLAPWAARLLPLPLLELSFFLPGYSAVTLFCYADPAGCCMSGDLPRVVPVSCLAVLTLYRRLLATLVLSVSRYRPGRFFFLLFFVLPASAVVSGEAFTSRRPWLVHCALGRYDTCALSGDLRLSTLSRRYVLGFDYLACAVTTLYLVVFFLLVFLLYSDFSCVSFFLFVSSLGLFASFLCIAVCALPPLLGVSSFFVSSLASLLKSLPVTCFFEPIILLSVGPASVVPGFTFGKVTSSSLVIVPFPFLLSLLLYVSLLPLAFANGVRRYVFSLLPLALVYSFLALRGLLLLVTSLSLFLLLFSALTLCSYVFLTLLIFSALLVPLSVWQRCRDRLTTLSAGVFLNERGACRFFSALCMLPVSSPPFLLLLSLICTFPSIALFVVPLRIRMRY